MTSRQKLIFIHSSDELYGADRMLLEMVGAATDTVEVEVWLPNDLKHPRAALCHELIRRNVQVRHLRLPIMRRANRNSRGLFALLQRSVALFRELRVARPQAVYCTTSPTFLGAPVARLAGVPKVIGHSQEIWSRADRYVLTWPALACQKMLAISSAVADSMSPRLRKRAVVVPNGTPEPQRVVTLDGRSGELQFLVASRWNGWKGYPTCSPRGTGPGRPVGSWCSAAHRRAAHRWTSPPWSPRWRSRARSR